MRRYYFDHNATTPVDPQVVEAMLSCWRENWGNPSSIHSFGQDARRLVENAREQTAALLGCAPKDLVFTSGGTEADNIAILGSLRNDKRPRKHVITTAIEHPAVLDTCHALEREGVELTVLPVGADALVSPDDVRRALRPETGILSF